MNYRKSVFLFVSLLIWGFSGSVHSQSYPSQWTLQNCIDYALKHNIQLQKSIISKSQTLSASTNQNVSWRPFSESTVNLSGGTFTSSSNEVSYNGSYGINANWTVWNGGILQQNVKKNRLSTEIAEQNIQETANSIQEQIVNYYVQILYQDEAVKVNKEIAEGAKVQRDRAKEMVEVGSLARADLA